MKPIRVAVVGAGRWGKNLIRNIRTSQRLELAAVCDRDSEQLEHFSDIETTVDPYAVFDEQDLTAVVIATPPSSHDELARAALGAGKHVLCEKPLALCVGQCEDLARLAEKNNRCLMVDCTPVYLNEIQLAKHKVPWNRVRHIHLIRSSAGLPGHHVDAVWDLGYHDLAVLYYWFGRLPRALSKTTPNGRIMTFSGEVDDGPAVSITVGYEFEPRRVITISGDLETRTFRQRQLHPEPLQSVVSHFADCVQTHASPITGSGCAIAIARCIQQIRPPEPN